MFVCVGPREQMVGGVERVGKSASLNGCRNRSMEYECRSFLTEIYSKAVGRSISKDHGRLYNILQGPCRVMRDTASLREPIASHVGLITGWKIGKEQFLQVRHIPDFADLRLLRTYTLLPVKVEI